MKKSFFRNLLWLKRSYQVAIIDVFIVLVSYSLAMLILFYEGLSQDYLRVILYLIPVAVFVHCALNLKFGLYSFVGRYVGLRQAISLVKATTIAALVLLSISLISIPVYGLDAFVLSLGVIPIGGMAVLISSGSIRFYPRVQRKRSSSNIDTWKNTLVVGAGDAGEQIIRSIQTDPHIALNVVALVDDDPKLHGLQIHGITIMGSSKDIPEIARENDIDEILVAIPSVKNDQLRRIWKIGSGAGLPVKTIGPSLNTHFCEIGVGQIRDIEIEDILDRQQVSANAGQISEFIKGKVVLVTGAGGSIGSELVMQIIRNEPSSVVLVDQDESALYQLHQNLSQNLFYDYEMVIADIKSMKKMRTIFTRTRPDIVFHAAAYKHVPLMEINPEEGVLNNVLGTQVVASVAGKVGVKSFVNISTDKAIDIVNILGATKRMGERLVAELEESYPDTKYCSVRFGNVLGTRGSVLPIFKQQILSGGPVTVTNQEMTRYFMTISEAVNLVLQASAFREGKAIFVLDMGEPVKILDLARQMIDFYQPENTIEIIFSGLRPGEKLHENLFDVSETPEVSGHPMISRVNPDRWGENNILDKLPLLFEKAEAQKREEMLELMQECVQTARPLDKMSADTPVCTENEGSTDYAGTKSESSLNYNWFNSIINNIDNPSHQKSLGADIEKNEILTTITSEMETGVRPKINERRRRKKLVRDKSSSIINAPWPSFGKDEIAAATRVLESGKVNYWTGVEGKRFEEEFAEFVDCKYAIALSSGTSALELALHSLDIKPWDEVIVPCRTYIASASSVVLSRATPVMADVDAESQNITVDTIKAVLTPNTKAIMAVHLAGWPCDMDPILELAHEHGIYVIEDCAQSHGALYKGRPVGSIGDAAAFSFCQDKIITTGGEGGMLTTNREDIYKRAWSYKDHGKDFDAVHHKDHPPGFRWLHESFGTNWRLSEIQSAIGRVQLSKLPGWVNTRKKNAAILNDHLAKIPGLRVTIPANDFVHSFYKYYVFVRPEHLAPGWSRDEIIHEINKEGVPCSWGSCSEIYLEGAFRNKGFYQSERLPVAQELGDTSIMLPVHPTMGEDDIHTACKVIEKVMYMATKVSYKDIAV